MKVKATNQKTKQRSIYPTSLDKTVSWVEGEKNYESQSKRLETKNKKSIYPTSLDKTVSWVKGKGTMQVKTKY